VKQHGMRSELDAIRARLIEELKIAAQQAKEL
jgi:hypothetical protein